MDIKVKLIGKNKLAWFLGLVVKAKFISIDFLQAI